jgi:hypothetical protein
MTHGNEIAAALARFRQLPVPTDDSFADLLAKLDAAEKQSRRPRSAC